MIRNITILKAKGPDQLWVKEVPGPNTSAEAEDFLVLVTKINGYCDSNDTLQEQLLEPSRGMYCLARRTADHTWYRAKIESMLHTTHGRQAHCLLVDYAEHIQVSVHRMCEIPEEFLQLPFQAKECRLHGIQPLTLAMSFETLTTEMVPCASWDTSAVEYFNDIIKDKSAQMKVHRVGRYGVNYITLYVNVEKELVNINQELVKREFAAMKEGDDADDEARAPSPAPSLEAMALIRSQGTTSSQEGSVRALSTEIGGRMSSPPSATRHVVPPPAATRQVSPTQEEKDKQQVLREKFHNSLKMHKVTPEGMLERSRKDAQGRDRGKQVSPSHPMEVLSTAEVKEKISQLGMPFGQQRTAPKNIAVNDGNHDQDLPACNEGVKNLATPETGRVSPSKGMGVTLLYHMSHGSGDERKSESQSPVGRHAENMSPRGAAGLNSNPEILQTAPSHAAIRAKSPLSSDYFSSGDDVHSDKKQRARSVLQQLAARGKAKMSSEDEEHRRALSPTSSDQMNVSSRPVGNKDLSSPDDTVNRPPFRKRTSSEDQSSAGESLSPSKSNPEQGAIRKTLAANKNSQRESPSSSKESPSRWSDDNKESALIIEQRINQMIHQPHQKKQASSTRKAPRNVPPGILLHGEMPPEPCTRFDETNFNDFILRNLQRNIKFSKPTSIQSFAWPAICRGRDMIGVGPKESGKKLAYLLPILSQIMQPSSYAALPIGCGPLAIVVCPTWMRAASAYNECLEFLGKNRKPRALLLHGAGSEENNQVQLVNGVDIVIVTISCLLRLLQGEHTNLNRLCHLVFDGADVLFSEFTNEVKQLMNEYAGAVAGWRPNLKCFKQLMVFSTTWTPALNSFLINYMTDPVVAITAPLEAAVYAHIKWMAQVTNVRQRFQYLCNVLDSCQASSSKVAVFVNTRKDAETLQKMLVNAQYYTLLAHKEMGSHHIEQVITDWRATHRGDSVPVLVLTDDIIRELGITNAACVIHYDFPKGKLVIGRRLGIMMDNFASQIDIDKTKDKTKKKKSSNCQTMLLLLEKDHTKYVPSLSRVLSRCSRDLSEKLGVEEAIQKKESQKLDIGLCHSLKRLGYCKEFPTCPDRHQINADIDSPGYQSLYMELPQCGIVKIHITYVVDASCYHGRILEYRSTEGSEPVDMTTKFSTLGMDMAMWYGADEARKQIHGSPKVNELCAYEDDQRALHRIRVVKLNMRSNVLKNVKVQFVDEGRYMDIQASKLLKLPARFHSIPFQAVEIFICKVKPVDKDTEWTDHACRHIHERIYKEELEGKIALSLGNTLWLDPLVQRVYLEEVKTMGDAINVRQELLKKDFAENNPKHLSKLRELCHGKIELPQMVPGINPAAESSSTILRPDTETMNETDEVGVYLSAVANPNLFYVQKYSMYTRLQKLYSSIQKKMESVEKDIVEWKPLVGDICLALFSFDDRWSRGTIVASNDSGEFDVFFVDYGDQEWKTKDEIRRPWNEILKLPFQAIRCSLADIGPTAEGWDKEAEYDAFWEMCHDQGDDMILTLKVKSVVTDRVSDTTKYIVDVYEDSGSERCLNIGHQLVLQGFAKGTEGFIKGMFPGAFEEEKSISDWLIKLCRQLYEAKERQRQLELARAIHQLVTNRRCNPNELCAEGALVSLCHLVSTGQITDTVVNNVLVISLVHVCHDNSRNCREMCKHGGLKEICQFLSRTDDEALQEKICWILKNVASIGSVVKKCIREYGGVSAICNLLTNTQSSKVANNACGAIGVLATNNSRNQDVIHEADGVASLCRMLEDGGDIAQEEVISSLSVLATHIRNRDGMRTEGGLKALCELLWEASDERIVFLLTNTLINLVENVENRNVMVDEDLPTCMEAMLLSSDFSHNTMVAIGALHGHLMERTRTKKLTSDNIRDDFEAIGLVPPIDTTPSSTSSKQTDQSGARRKQTDQSGMTNGVAASHTDASITVNGHMEDNGAVEIPPDLPPLEDDGDIVVRATPKVKWSQRRDTITLSVDLRGVTDFDIEVLPKDIYFSTQLDVPYEFHLKLFSQVNTTNYKAAALGGEVLITLYKETPNTKWSRLTKNKCGFVITDFERYENDSSSDEDPRFAKKKNKNAADKSKNTAKMPKLKKYKSGATNAMPPEMDTSSDSDDSAYSHSDRSSDAEFGFADESEPNTAVADSS